MEPWAIPFSLNTTQWIAHRGKLRLAMQASTPYQMGSTISVGKLASFHKSGLSPQGMAGAARTLLDEVPTAQHAWATGASYETTCERMGTVTGLIIGLVKFAVPTVIKHSYVLGGPQAYSDYSLMAPGDEMAVRATVSECWAVEKEWEAYAARRAFIALTDRDVPDVLEDGTIVVEGAYPMARALASLWSQRRVPQTVAAHILLLSNHANE